MKHWWLAALLLVTSGAAIAAEWATSGPPGCPVRVMLRPAQPGDPYLVAVFSIATQETCREQNACAGGVQPGDTQLYMLHFGSTEISGPVATTMKYDGASLPAILQASDGAAFATGDPVAARARRELEAGRDVKIEFELDDGHRGTVVVPAAGFAAAAKALDACGAGGNPQ